MTSPISRARIAEIEHRMFSPMVTYRENVRDDMPALLATAEWGWDEHDRAERLAAEVERLGALADMRGIAERGESRCSLRT